MRWTGWGALSIGGELITAINTLYNLLSSGEYMDSTTQTQRDKNIFVSVNKTSQKWKSEKNLMKICWAHDPFNVKYYLVNQYL